MLTISVKTNAEDVARQLRDIARVKMPVALSNAINVTADQVRDAEVREMRDVFDRPTPWTLGAIRVKKSTPKSLTAIVGFTTDGNKQGRTVADYLRPEVQGGGRGLKRFEKLMRSIGVLPEGMYAVPGSAAKMDQYGNMSRGQIVQILSYFKAFPEAGYKANMTDARKARMAKGTKKRHGVAYFVGRPGDGRGPLGIWMRMSSVHTRGSGIAPVMIFVDWASYQAIYDFDYVAKITVSQQFERNFARQQLGFG